MNKTYGKYIKNTIALLLFAMLFYGIWRIGRDGALAGEYNQITRCTENVIEYLHENQRLPTNAELKEMHRSPYDYEILTEFDVKSVRRVDNKLLDIETGQQVLIFNGRVMPMWTCKKIHREFYEDTTIQIYNAMSKDLDSE